MHTNDDPGGGNAASCAPSLAARATGFLRGLPRDWVVTASRTSFHRLVYQMLVPYLSVYTLALGATKTELGLVNCAGMAVAAFLLARQLNSGHSLAISAVQYWQKSQVASFI